MKFIDRVKIYVQAGTGGNGTVAFRREAHVPREVHLEEMEVVAEVLSSLQQTHYQLY